MMLTVVMTPEEVLEACSEWLERHGADLTPDQLKFSVNKVEGNITYTVPPNPKVQVVAEVETTHITGPYR